MTQQNPAQENATQQPQGAVVEKKYEIQVNRQHFTWLEQLITGHQVLNLVGEDDGKHGVAILRGGTEHDVPLGLDDSVDLEDAKNRRFKTFPDKSTEG